MDDWRFEPARDVGLTEPQRWRSLRRESGLVSTAIHIVWWAFIRTYLALWHRLRIVGRENLPSRLPFVLVANHASHLDALVLAAPLPWWLRDRIFPIAAGDVFFEVPAIAAFAALAVNALPMWRKNCGPQALRELRKRLADEPCAYILFPEGGRSRDGQIRPFKSGLGMLVAGTDVPVVPCHLQGCFAALRAGSKLPRPMPIELRVGPALCFTNAPNERSGWEEIAATLRKAIDQLRDGRQ